MRDPKSWDDDQGQTLLHDGASPTLRLVIARRIPTRLFATLLAFIAIAGMFALSTWHVAQVHDEDPIHFVSTRHVHSDDQAADPDSAVHLAAHAVGHGLAFPSEAAAALVVFSIRQIWAVAIGAFRPGPESASLLRPPQD